MQLLREFIQNVLGTHASSGEDVSSFVDAVDELLAQRGEPSCQEQGIPFEMLRTRFERGDTPEKIVDDMFGY